MKFVILEHTQIQGSMLEWIVSSIRPNESTTRQYSLRLRVIHEGIPHACRNTLKTECVSSILKSFHTEWNILAHSQG